MKKHMTVCAGKEGIIYAFENGQIVNFQDNFKFLSDAPFTVYFDFETTTGNSAFSDPKMYVIIYCQIYSFHPSLNLDKIITKNNAYKAYNKENPIDKQKTICSICGFLLDVNNGGWIDFVIRCEYLLLKNIYSYEELEKIKIGSEEKFFVVVRRVFEYYPIFEETLQDCDEYDQISDRVQDFLVEYLDDAYNDSKELRENIANIQVPKKDYLLKEKVAFSLTN